MNRRRLAFALATTLCAAGCGDKSVTLHFSALVGTMPFKCGQTYAGIGTGPSMMAPLDLRFFVHDVKLVRASGEKVAFALSDDGKWQGGGVALLDFEDSTGSCQNASPETNTALVGSVAAHPDYTGVEFGIGVPPAQDHLEATKAAPPLNVQALFWTWLSGYRYFKLDVGSASNMDWAFHLGANGCQATASSYDCQTPNLPLIALAGFDAGKNTIALDVAALLADSNLDMPVDKTTNTVAGCMSDTMDPECPALFHKMGLELGSNDPGPAQAAFFSR